MICKTGLTMTAAATVIFCGSVMAEGIISLNLAENAANQVFAGGTGIGPLYTDSANWNTTIDFDTGELKAGSMADLIDNDGTNTGASVVWESATVWYNGDGVADDEHKLAVGYLDDGNNPEPACSVIFSNIPYASYRVYGLLSSGQVNDTAYTTRDFQINSGLWVFGGVSAGTSPAYGNIDLNNSMNGSFWTEIAGGTNGNYWTTEVVGPTLTIRGQNRSGPQRGSLAGIVIEDITIFYPKGTFLQLR